MGLLAAVIFSSQLISATYCGPAIAELSRFSANSDSSETPTKRMEGLLDLMVNEQHLSPEDLQIFADAKKRPHSLSQLLKGRNFSSSAEPFRVVFDSILEEKDLNWSSISDFARGRLVDENKNAEDRKATEAKTQPIFRIKKIGPFPPLNANALSSMVALEGALIHLFGFSGFNQESLLKVRKFELDGTQVFEKMEVPGYRVLGQESLAVSPEKTLVGTVLVFNKENQKPAYMAFERLAANKIRILGIHEVAELQPADELRVNSKYIAVLKKSVVWKNAAIYLFNRKDPLAPPLLITTEGGTIDAKILSAGDRLFISYKKGLKENYPLAFKEIMSDGSFASIELTHPNQTLLAQDPKIFPVGSKVMGYYTLYASGVKSEDRAFEITADRKLRETFASLPGEGLTLSNFVAHQDEAFAYDLGERAHLIRISSDGKWNYTDVRTADHDGYGYVVAVEFQNHILGAWGTYNGWLKIFINDRLTLESKISDLSLANFRWMDNGKDLFLVVEYNDRNRSPDLFQIYNGGSH